MLVLEFENMALFSFWKNKCIVCFAPFELLYFIDKLGHILPAEVACFRQQGCRMLLNDCIMLMETHVIDADIACIQLLS